MIMRLSTCILSSVRVRFAPSPTGRLHLGGLRTAAYNYLFARQRGGSFILRLEDTDTRRMQIKSYEHILSSLNWAGIYFDEGPHVGGNYGPYIQSERSNLYTFYVEGLISEGFAYPCFCSERRLKMIRNAQSGTGNSKYDGKCCNLSTVEAKQRMTDESYTIRLKVPKGLVTVNDDVFGDVTRDPAIEGDIIIVKSDGLPVYHFANVIDDHLMGITHVLRGSEWLISTHKHILIYEAFGWKPPTYAHLPLLLNPDGSKLSKRSGSLVDIDQLCAHGYLPLAVLNHVLLGSAGFLNRNDPQNMQKLVSNFDIKKLSNHSGILDSSKLAFYNRSLMKRLMGSKSGTQTLVEKLRELGSDLLSNATGEFIKHVLEQRVDHINCLFDLFSTPYLFLWQSPAISVDEISLFIDDPEPFLQVFMDVFVSSASISNCERVLTNNLKRFCVDEEVNFSASMKLIRVVLTGTCEGPAVAQLIFILGTTNVKSRIEFALELLAAKRTC